MGGQKGIVICLTLVVLILFQVDFSTAAAIGVNRADINYKNVLRGGYAEEEVFVSTDAPRNISLEYFFEGEIKDWMRLEPSKGLIFSRNSGRVITVIAEPPPDAANGIYTGRLRLKTGPLAADYEGHGASVLAAFTIKITIEITGDEIRGCNVGGIKLKDTELDFPIEFSMSIKNNGNVRLNPRVTLDIWDQSQTNLISTKEATFEDILPTATNEQRFRLDNDLDLGQYWVDFLVPECNSNELYTFSVLERGGVSDQGQLIRIFNPAWVETGEIVPIKAVFQNTGPRTVSAKFTGTVNLKDKIVKVIETDEINVPPREFYEFETFFQPDLPGSYLVFGRINYNNKLTFEKSSVLNVNPSEELKDEQLQKRISTLVPVILSIIILIILIMIKRKKTKQKRMHRPY